MVELLLSRYLEESYSANSYVVNVYVVPGPQAIRLTRISREDLTNNKGPRVKCSFRKVARKKAAGKSTKGTSKKASNEDPVDHRISNRADTKRKRQHTLDRDDKVDRFNVADEDGLGSDDDIEDFSNKLREVDAEESEHETDDWTFSMGTTSHLPKKARKSGEGRNAIRRLDKTQRDNGEIISLLSD